MLFLVKIGVLYCFVLSFQLVQSGLHRFYFHHSQEKWYFAFAYQFQYKLKLTYSYTNVVIVLLKVPMIWGCWYSISVPWMVEFSGWNPWKFLPVSETHQVFGSKLGFLELHPYRKQRIGKIINYGLETDIKLENFQLFRSNRLASLVDCQMLAIVFRGIICLSLYLQRQGYLNPKTKMR